MRILVVEDEKTLAEALEEILKLNKYSVDVVHDGQEALDYLREVQYDGIVLDIMMPKIDGIQVLKTMRANGNRTPVIMLTAKSEVDDKVLGLDSGADDYLTKPFAAKELLARIRNITRNRLESTGANLTAGNLTLNRTAFTLSNETETITLTNKEYQLLELLFNNIDRYIGSEELMTKIWGYDSDSEINVVWTHLSYIRKKLEKLDPNVKIKSSRNLGYSLEVLNG